LYSCDKMGAIEVLITIFVYKVYVYIVWSNAANIVSIVGFSFLMPRYMNGLWFILGEQAEQVRTSKCSLCLCDFHYS
jgi:hypothetical protein